MRSHWSIVRLPSPPLVEYTTLVITNLCPVIIAKVKLHVFCTETLQDRAFEVTRNTLNKCRWTSILAKLLIMRLVLLYSNV